MKRWWTSRWEHSGRGKMNIPFTKHGTYLWWDNLSPSSKHKQYSHLKWGLQRGKYPPLMPLSLILWCNTDYLYKRRAPEKGSYIRRPVKTESKCSSFNLGIVVLQLIRHESVCGKLVTHVSVLGENYHLLTKSNLLGNLSLRYLRFRRFSVQKFIDFKVMFWTPMGRLDFKI